MTRIINYRQESDELDELIRGQVMANRVNEVVADHTTKRYMTYLKVVQDGFMKEPIDDPSAPFRDRPLVARAIEAYELRNEVEVQTGVLYQHDQFPIVAVPDGVDADLIGITVHVHCGSRERSAYETYREAVERGVTAAMYRHAIAMMATTRLPYWLHLQYLELPEQGIRKLHEHEVEYSKGRGEDLMSALIAFAAKSRFKAQSEAAA